MDSWKVRLIVLAVAGGVALVAPGAPAQTDDPAIDPVAAGAGAAREGLDEVPLPETPESAADEEDVQREERPVMRGEILVTASKRGEVDAQSLPLSLTAFDSRKLERLEVVDFDDFIVQVPSTNFIDNGGPGRGKEVASIRGLSPVADNTVGVVAQYLDGAPRFGNNYRPFDIGEISVLRGPQGTLWGSQAIGGLISYRSSRPDLARVSASVETELYATGSSDGFSSRTAAFVSVPLAEGILGLRVAAQHIDEKGYVDNIATGEEDVNDVRETAWRVSMLYQPSDKVSITTIYHGSDLSADAPSYFQPELGTYTTDAPFSRLPADQEYALVNLLVDADLGWATLGYSGAYFDLENTYSDAERGFFGFIPVARTDTILEQQSWTHELRLASKAGGRLNWLVGLFHDDLQEVDLTESYEVQDPTSATPPALGDGMLVFYLGGPENLLERAVFGEVSYDFTDRWQLLVGGRLFDWEVENFQDTVFLGTGFGQETGTVGNDDSFYKIQLTGRLHERVLAYAARSEGFRIGGFNPFVGPDWNSSLEFLRFDPDRLVNYEIGVKSSLLEDRMQLNAAVYRMDWEDVQSVVFDEIGVFAFTANASDLEAEGFEIEITTQDLFGRGVYAAGSYTYNDNEFTRDARIYDDVRLLIEKGDKLRRTPRNSWSLDLGYDFAISSRMVGFARANYWHKDETTTEGFNRQDGNVPIPAQDVVNASFGVLSGPWELKAIVNNLTNSDPYLQVFPGGAVGAPDSDRAVRVSSIRPRAIRLQLTYRY